MKISHYISIDLGATSGRTMLATFDGQQITLTELTRFANPMIPLGGHLFWDLPSLYNEVLRGLQKAAASGINPVSIGIDTWGCDVAYFGHDGQLLGLPYCYRDSHTDGATERFFEKMPAKEVYEKTGIQFMNFNTLFQLDTLHSNCCSALDAADKILFIPDALSYMLTGRAVTEYTVASTSQILNAVEREFDPALLDAIGISRERFGEMVQPGTVIGTLTEQVQQATGLGAVKVVAVAGHDTASAVAAVPAENERFAYLSSGTWSLMGIETKESIINDDSFRHNFTNEGGIGGTTRFLKNICGMWILEQCRREWEREGKCYSYPEIVEMANSAEPFVSFINPDDASFANPQSMLKAIEAFCIRTGQPAPQNDTQIIRTIFESLALRYREVLEILESMAPFAIDVLHIIGGGSKNQLLNQFTANAIGKRVVAGPSEATAIGNLMMQAIGAGEMSTLAEARTIIRASIETETFLPQQREAWEAAYARFVELK